MGSSAQNKARQMLKLRVLVIALFLAFVLLISLSLTTSERGGWWRSGGRYNNKMECMPASATQPCGKLPDAVAEAVVHYAASNITPQQTTEEIALSQAVLRKKSPCNMLVFGLGYDSLMWATLNYGGRTVFLEEDDDWLRNMHVQHPSLVSHHVDYPTMVTEAIDLLAHARSESACEPRKAKDLQYSKCKLALTNLPPEIYSIEWDVIMIDAPRGYFPEAPGRMQAIFSTAVLALNKPKGADTDIFVHDSDRTVEDTYSKEFLCSHNLVASAGRIRHFNVRSKTGASSFCDHRSPSSS